MSRKHNKGNNTSSSKPSINEAGIGAKAGNGVELQRASGDFSNLIKYTGNLSFNNPLGEQIKVLNSQHVPGSDIAYTYGTYADGAIPGMLTVDVIPSAGVSRGPSATINVAMNRIYGRTRYENSGASNYDNVDEFIYIMCVSSLHLMYYWLRRTYGRLRTFLNWNRYSAPSELDVLGFDWSDLSTKMPQFAATLDIMRAQVAVFKIPTDFRMINSQIALYSNIYKDSPLEKAQELIFRPAGFYKFELDSEGKGKAAFRPIDYSVKLTLADIVSLINEFIGPIVADNDFNIISGDIFKAYGTTYELAACPQDYSVDAVYNYDILHAFENAVVLPPYTRWISRDVAPTYNLDITQTADSMLNPYIEFKPSFSIALDEPSSYSIYAPGWEMKSRLNAHDDNPEPGTVANMCKWKIIASPASDLSAAIPHTALYSINSSGTEFLTNLQLWRFNNANPRVLVAIQYSTYEHVKNTLVAADREDLLSAFNAHPQLIHMTRTSDTAWVVHYPLAEVDNYTFIDYDTLNKIQEAFIMDQYSLLDTSKY